MHGSFTRGLAYRKRRCNDRTIKRGLIAVAILAAPAAALLAVGIDQARQHPELAPGGRGAVALVVQLGAGAALVAAALHTVRRLELALAAALFLGVAGLGLQALPAPPDGALLFTLALVGAGLPAAAAAHAALLHPGGHASGRLDRVGIAVGYAVNVGLLGLLPALVFDPRQTGCFACPDNVVLVHPAPTAAEWLGHWAPPAAATTDVALAALIAARLLLRPAAARALAAPVSAAAIFVLGLAAVANVRATDGLAAVAADRLLWLTTVATLGLMAAGVFWRPLRAVRVRGALGRLTVATAATADDVADALGRVLGDSSASLVVPHPETREPITLDGVPADAVAPPGRARTAVERSGRTVAWVEHDAGLAADPALLTSSVRSAGLTLEREALRVAAGLQAQELRESTLRLLSTGEAERRRLERDLHDGAQQRLLAFGIRLARARAAATREVAAVLSNAEARVSATRNELRQIAHGIHAVTLAEGGLAEAVLALVRTAEGGVSVDALPDRRGSAAAETAVYRVFAACLRFARADVRIAIQGDDSELEASVHVSDADAGELANALAHAGARVAALGGSLTITADDRGAYVNTRVPVA